MLVKQERERRKVQISGKSSCMVGLPKKWVTEMGLEQGSEVTITRLSSRSLIVSAQAESSQGGREAVIKADAETSLETIFRKIVSLYVLGFSRILIEGPGGFLGKSKKLSLKSLVRRHLIGTEGVAELREGLTVHVLLGYSELNVESALKKMLLIIDSVMEDAARALETGDAGLADSTSDRCDEVGRFGLYVIRQLNLSLNQEVLPDLRLENRDTLGYILVARILERITSHAASLSRTIGDLEKPPVGPLYAKAAAMSEEAATLVDDALLSMFKRDHAGADVLVERSKRFVERETEMIKSLEEGDSQNYYTWHVLMDSLRRIAEYAREVAEVVLDMTVERTLQKQETIVPQVVLA